MGFLAVAAIVNAEFVDSGTQAAVATASDWLSTLAFVGLGFELNPRRFRATDLWPIAVILASFNTVSLLTFTERSSSPTPAKSSTATNSQTTSPRLADRAPLSTSTRRKA